MKIVAVGNRQPEWVVAGCEEYLKRMPRELATQLVEIKPEPRASGRSREQLMAGERQRIEGALTSGARIVALDERGEDLGSERFARRIETWMGDGRETHFVIGGADGLDPALKERADSQLRLSSLTLPHGIARLLLCEQLYRAATLIKGHPYHRP